MLYISVNLLGLFVRGLFPDLELKRVKREFPIFVAKAGSDKEYIDQQKKTTIIAFLANIVFFYLLFRLWNIGFAIAVLMIMLGRLPDLLWDIKHGKKTDPKSMKKNFLYHVNGYLIWLALPVIYHSLY